MNTIIEVRDLYAGYDNKVVLRDVNLNLYEKDYLGIIGPNGGGKTTFIKCLLGLKKQSKGTITFYRNGQKTDNLEMGYLPQYNAIDKEFPISIKEVILSGLNRRRPLIGGYSKEQKAKAEKVISQMGLDGMGDRQIGELSGGQIQRTLLGRAIISEPDVLILDEPSTYIDKYHEYKLYELLNQINSKCAIILVSHDIGTVLQNVKSIACINGTLDYHPDTGITEEWLTRNFNCPIDLIGHGNLPHRILKNHNHPECCD